METTMCLRSCNMERPLWGLPVGPCKGVGPCTFRIPSQDDVPLVSTQNIRAR